jgi:hypothetical protein
MRLGSYARLTAPRGWSGAGPPRLSGGVDSAVTAALLHRAIGEQLTCVFGPSTPCASSSRTRSATRRGAGLALRSRVPPSVSRCGAGCARVGEVRRESVETLRQAESIYIEELRAAGFYERVSQAFAVFLPVRSVEVTGDPARLLKQHIGLGRCFSEKVVPVLEDAMTQEDVKVVGWNVGVIQDLPPGA